MWESKLGKLDFFCKIKVKNFVNQVIDERFVSLDEDVKSRQGKKKVETDKKLRKKFKALKWLLKYKYYILKKIIITFSKIKETT